MCRRSPDNCIVELDRFLPEVRQSSNQDNLSGALVGRVLFLFISAGKLLIRVLFFFFQVSGTLPVRVLFLIFSAK